VAAHKLLGPETACTAGLPIDTVFHDDSRFLDCPVPIVRQNTRRRRGWRYGAGAVLEQGAVWLELTYVKGLTVGGGPIEKPIAID
jgi:hypothetical protein